MTDVNTATKTQLIEALAELETQMEHIAARSGCPQSFMPIDKLSVELGVSKNIILFAVERDEIKGRLYSTATGGHIINCKGYPVNKTKAAVQAIIRKSSQVTKNQIKHDETGRVFGGGEMMGLVGNKL